MNKTERQTPASQRKKNVLKDERKSEGQRKEENPLGKEEKVEVLHEYVWCVYKTLLGPTDRPREKVYQTIKPSIQQSISVYIPSFVFPSNPLRCPTSPTRPKENPE